MFNPNFYRLCVTIKSESYGYAECEALTSDLLKALLLTEWGFLFSNKFGSLINFTYICLNKRKRLWKLT